LVNRSEILYYNYFVIDASRIFSDVKLDGLLIGVGRAVTVVRVVTAFIKYCRKDIMA